MNPNTANIQVATSPQEAAAMINPIADPEFDQTMLAIEEDKKKKMQDELTKLKKDTPKQEPKPLRLTYKWEGNCPTCGRAPTTLMVDTPEGYFAICYCIQDDVQLTSLKVVNLYTEGSKVK